MTASQKIAYQGEPGAFSHQACRRWFPDYEPTAFPSFEAAFAAVEAGECALGMIPVENALAGRVADVHHLLPHSGLKIIGERFLPIEMTLMGTPDAELSDIKVAFSHTMALMQCRNSLNALGIRPEIYHDTAGAARRLSETKERDRAAIAPEIAAELYGLKILRRNLEDAHNNTTRFLVLSAQAEVSDPVDAERVLTSFVFGVRNIPAALYKALGGFATSGINMIRLESYIRDGIFASTFFYAEVEGRPSDRLLKLAFEELAFFAEEVELLGVYAMDPFRASQGV
ncbi:prephenate dehydratase [Asticcacaulis excentricus]|uniref:prephenate dehydratase n=1 Tax=Asticcacaulis excentricus (strain ATCC 15261 / DSM 4724 / KCTC 12464 / NCIMB 9791 / VKM B-1370 / CB 48) TaxID=573065 RepID=E8RQ77_ASTEC|nr:prephenate dehydratase [Asticcacaulis excentricus]ADU12134.1 Prephenate dehydratase [Asticcacaulis excentricus CB 48]